VSAGLVFSLTATLAVLWITCAPVLYLRFRRGAAWRWFWLGIASWSLALVLKLVLYAIVGSFGPPPGVLATAAGLASAACELGMAAVFLRRRPLPTADVLAFGTGIGAFEVLFTLVVAALGVGADVGGAAGGAATMSAALACFFFLLERAVTLVGHVASRVLVYESLQSRRLLPAGVAVATFACVDGTTAYGEVAGWAWNDAALRAWFMGFIIVVGAIEVLAARVFWDPLPASRGKATAP